MEPDKGVDPRVRGILWVALIAKTKAPYKEAAESSTGTRADSQDNQETTATT